MINETADSHLGPGGGDRWNQCSEDGDGEVDWMHVGFSEEAGMSSVVIGKDNENRLTV